MLRHLRFNWENQFVKRTVIGIGLFALLAVALGFRELFIYVFDAFVMVGVFICVHEMMKAKKLGTKGVRDYYVYPYIVIAYLIFLLGIVIANPFSFWIHIVLQLVLIFVLCIYVFFMAYTDRDFIKQCKLDKRPIGKASRSVVWEYVKLLIYPALLLFTLIPLNHIGNWVQFENVETLVLTNAPLIGLFALLLVFGISTFTDIFCYCAGKMLGGKKICPKISPNKTVSGFIGGLFGGVIGALVVMLALSANAGVSGFFTQRIGNASAVIGFTIAIGLLGAFITQMGDWFASWTKRKHNIKDFGNILPGHGGLMDRFDGIAFNACFIFFVMMIVVFLVPYTAG